MLSGTDGPDSQPARSLAVLRSAPTCPCRGGVQPPRHGTPGMSESLPGDSHIDFPPCAKSGTGSPSRQRQRCSTLGFKLMYFDSGGST